MRKLLTATAAFLVLGSSSLLVACGGEQAPAAPAKVTHAKFNPANFGDPATGANPYLPVVPGSQWVREGFTDVGDRRVPHQVTTTVSDVYRTVDGVRTVAMFDYELDGGQVSQLSIDYVAEDKDGNIWVLGGYTEEYEGGRFLSAVDPWLAGVNGAKPGIVVQGDPQVGTPPYAVAQPDAEEGDVAEVIDVGGSRCVPYKCFKDVLIVREGKESAPDNEFKYYARGVGQIDNVPRGDSVHQDVERLINVSKLSRKGLAETSAEVLRLDHHAAQTTPKIFGDGPSGKRA
ncbi:MAG: hypothetical protein ABIZ50_01175 [Solirubrobacterales bacterium]